MTDKSKIKVSFYVSSIELLDSVANKIKSNNMIRLNITQKPILIKDEYIVNHIEGLNNLKHEFIAINDPESMKELTLTLRKVEKKRCLSNALKTSRKNKSMSDNNSSTSNIQYKYNQHDHSLLGYFTINIENLEKEVQYSMKVDIITKYDSILIGYANIEIFKCDEIYVKKKDQSKKNKNTKKNNAYVSRKNKEIFDDPNCYLLD